MATSIGALSVDLLHGTPKEPRLRVETWQVPGLSGYGAMTHGLGESEFDAVSVTYCADDTAAQAHINTAGNVTGTVVDFTDNWGNAYHKVLVIAMDQAIKKKVIRNGANQVRVELHWKMLKNV